MTTKTYKNLRQNQSFQFLPDGDVYVRCHGGFRPGRGGKLIKFNYPDCPVIFYESTKEVNHDHQNLQKLALSCPQSTA